MVKKFSYDSKTRTKIPDRANVKEATTTFSESLLRRKKNVLANVSRAFIKSFVYSSFPQKTLCLKNEEKFY